MAETHEIFTRMQLRYDSYTAWSDVSKEGCGANFVLLAGEIGIAKLVNDITIPLDEDKNAPVLFKVGDGVHKFSELPWVSGLAADVYAWAKKATPDWTDFPALPLTVVDEGTGKFVTDFTYADNKLTITRSDVDWNDVQNKPDFDGTYKQLQEIVSAEGSTSKTITKVEQDEQGKVTVTYGDIAFPEVTIPDVTVVDDAEAEVPTTETVNVYKNLTANGHALTEELVEVATKKAVDNALQTAKEYADDELKKVVDAQKLVDDAQDATIAQALADAKKHADDNEKDTKTAVKASGNYITVDGPAALVENATNEYAISINEDALKTLIGSQTTAAMEFKGATAELPAEPAKGDMWKVSGEFEVAGATAKVGDAIVYNGTEWFLIPSGDDIEDTWRPIELNGEVIFGGGITSGNLNLVPGTNITIEAKTGEDGKTYLNFAVNDTTYSADESSLHLEGTEFGVKEGGIETKHIKDGNVIEVKLEQNVQDALALARTALQEHQSLDNYKTKQTAVTDKGLTGAKVLGALTQNENGEIDYTVRDLTPADIGAQVAGDYATKQEVADQDVVILAEAQKYIDGKVGELHSIATSGSIYDIAEGYNTSIGEDGVKYLVFNCGTSTTVI